MALIGREYFNRPQSVRVSFLFPRHGLATLLEGVNNKFFKVNFKNYILFKNYCFKAVKLVKKVILVINGVSTIYFGMKNDHHLNPNLAEGTGVLILPPPYFIFFQPSVSRKTCPFV